jgi:CheY-like chemotaxis protein
MEQLQLISSDRLDFQDLMLHRIYEILLVASPYDAYILEEDGRLTEQVLHEYLGMNFSYAPRVWRADSGSAALNLITKRKFDLIISMMRITDMDPLTFGSRIKKMYPKKPVILLAFDESEIKQLPDPIPKKSIDKIFIWSGDASVFPAIIKYIEDKANAERDITKGDVRAIIFIEDNPRDYSVILPMIYREIMYHTKQLVSKSLNDAHRMLHLRGRPKIFLVSTYEDAQKYYRRYHSNILGVISDIRFPRNGKLDPRAGIKFSRYARKIEPSMPIMLQSSAAEHAVEAEKIHTRFLHKQSITLLQELREFILENFGFGDFVFRLKNGKQIARAENLEELVSKLKIIPEESLVYHASSNHFSNWLAARGEFDLASVLRPLQLNDFESVEAMREYLIQAINRTLENRTTGSVIDYRRELETVATKFIRLSSGSLGGKARGLAFLNSIIARSGLQEKFPGVNIRIPQIAVIGTDEFEKFMDKYNLWDKVLMTKSNEEVDELFLKGDLSLELTNALRKFLTEVHFPLAVRSSSLLEDSQYQPLAGVYATYMLPNSATFPEVRLRQLTEAIIRVYASTYYQESKSLIESSVHRLEEERMAVIIMELVGQKYDHRFYPTLSGIAQSINYYPVSYMKREEGIATIALGLGRIVVEGGKALRFSPHYPGILPQYYSIKATLNNSQNHFYALNLDPKIDPLKNGEKGNLHSYGLEVAEQDGALTWAASVVCSDDNIIRDSLRYKGPRVITFAPVLKWNTFPLADLLVELLDLGSKALGCPVEIEFAANLYNERGKKPEFYLLQIKPMVIASQNLEHELGSIKEEEVFCRSTTALGNGTIEGIRDIIVVDPERFDAVHSHEIAEDIEAFNQNLHYNHPYILIGPGRWGSADPWLGIPVNWRHISGARIIVEVGRRDFPVDPSFGSHFFQNVTSMRIGYFTVDHKSMEDCIDLDWLKNQPTMEQRGLTRWVRLEQPLFVRIDGKTGHGIILKPREPEPERMDEQESTGI